MRPPDAVWRADGRASSRSTGSGARRRRAGADRVLQRAAALGPGQPDDDRVVRSSRARLFAADAAAQRRVRIGEHAGGRRRMGHAGRDDAGRSVVLDRRRLLQVDRVRPTTPTSWGCPTARSATTAATPPRSAPFATTRGTSARVYGYDQWTVSPRLVLGYGTGFARYDYLGGSGSVEPAAQRHGSARWLPREGARVARAVVPGAEEFAPSVTGLWLPPERTFSSLARDGRFTAEQTRHLQVSLERDLAAGVTVSLRGFDQRVDDQLVEMFDVDLPGPPRHPSGTTSSAPPAISTRAGGAWA